MRRPLLRSLRPLAKPSQRTPRYQGWRGPILRAQETTTASPYPLTTSQTPAPTLPASAPLQRNIIPSPVSRLSVGTDICHVPRIQRVIDYHGVERFARRVLTWDEVERAVGRGYLLRAGEEDLGDGKGEKGRVGEEREEGKGGVLMGVSREAVFLAGRWAAKEAVKKAFPHRGLGWHDVVIERQRAADGEGVSFAPVALVRDGERGWEEVPVSISHDGEYATATCIGYGYGGGEQGGG